MTEGRKSPGRSTLQSIMVGVALVAALLSIGKGITKLAIEWQYSTFLNGRNNSGLPPGLPVVSVSDVAVGETTLPSGTTGTVFSDNTDDDSTYPDRAVDVTITAGPHVGKTLPFHRRSLRAR